ncbi:hypothetical protein D0469_15325 [Peribacillus saganii]|uniref:Uncharacterized protein n=1 Tax=Peribacillus saganii TaxID=2303992 RepID=A0A372LKJ6_9BACI|nr:hypothetical protein D0469_15325 [Peribacillus saganii]
MTSRGWALKLDIKKSGSALAEEERLKVATSTSCASGLYFSAKKSYFNLVKKNALQKFFCRDFY